MVRALDLLYITVRDVIKYYQSKYVQLSLGAIHKVCFWPPVLCIRSMDNFSPPSPRRVYALFGWPLTMKKKWKKTWNHKMFVLYFARKKFINKRLLRLFDKELDSIENSICFLCVVFIIIQSSICNAINVAGMVNLINY